jgi:hypothetical protein
MRKRFALIWTMVVLGLALMMPASTAAGVNYGRIVFVSGYCEGNNTVNATFKLTKYSGFYATDLSMTAKGQRYYSGGWHTVYNIGTWWKTVNTSGQTTMKRSFWFNPGAAGKYRILVQGRIWDGSYRIASGKAHSGWCQ